MYKNVLEWLEKNKSSQKVVYQDSNNCVTFADVYDRARRIGSSLKSVKRNAPIAIIAGRNVSTVCGYLGVIYSGHTYAPIDSSLPRARIEMILAILQPGAIVADADNLSLAKSFCDESYLLDELAKGPVDLEYLRTIRDEMVMTDPLYIIFTSGSTGRPKGVITSHQSLMCYIESYVDIMEIDQTDILGNQSPLDYIAAIRDIYIPLLCGCSTVIIPTEYFMQPTRLFDYMNDKHVTSVGWSVSALSVPVRMGVFREKELKTLRKICFSGSVMPSPVLRTWQEHLPFAKFVNQYGPTEATASCTYYVVDHKIGLDEQLPIGRPYRNYKVFLLNEDLSLTSDGDIGEICVSGPILALGYYNDAERTSQSFIVNPNVTGFPEKMYRTGDYGKRRSDGMLEFHGRKDRQIKHMGHRVELDEIEHAAIKIEGVNECAALYNVRSEIICLFYSGFAEKRSVVIALRQNLPLFMVPRKIVKLEMLPKLSNGKTDMNQLKESMLK